jgi:apolipoprotein N-acyltransferase
MTSPKYFVRPSGWRRFALSFAGGAIGTLAMPPFGFLPALAVSLSVSVWLIDGSGERLSRSTLASVALLGWMWGFGYFVASLWWLGAAFLVEADQFAWALPFGVFGLPALLAFFPAVGFALARVLWSASAARVFALAFGLGVTEWLRGTLFTGFPWNTLGMALGQDLWLMQSASVIGLYGLTVMAVLICAAPGVVASWSMRDKGWISPVLAASALLGLAAFGAVRLPAQESPLIAGVKLRVMQPNIPQGAKFGPDNADEIMHHYLRLSGQVSPSQPGGVGDTTHLIWPEGAFPFLLHQEPQRLDQIAELLPYGVTLITGAVRTETPQEAVEHFYNSIHVVGDDGAILDTYDKAHLVPFGEYFPSLFDAALRGIGLRQFVHVPEGLQAGKRGSSIRVANLPPIAPAICYEAIFPGALVHASPRPKLILNLTNDAWFGHTPGPHQHFAQARLRAVEEGIPLVRAANTGISAVVDSYGRVLHSLPLGSEGVIDSFLPTALAPPLYALSGDLAFAVMLLACGAFAANGTFHRRRLIPAAA